MRTFILVLILVASFNHECFCEKNEIHEQYSMAEALFNDINKQPWHHDVLPRYDVVISMARAIVIGSANSEIAIRAQGLIVTCYDRQAEYKKQWTAFKKYLAMSDKRFGREKSAEIIAERANSSFEREEYIESERLYRFLLHDYPQSEFVPLCLFRTAKIHEVFGEFQKALDMYDKLIETKSSSSYAERAREDLKRAHRKAVYACYKRGRFRKVVEMIDAFAEKLPKSDAYIMKLYYLGRMKWTGGIGPQKVSEFQEIIKYYPDTEWARKVKIHMRDRKSTPYSAGPDGKVGTEDDLVKLTGEIEE